jgi:hypothetical protein
MEFFLNQLPTGDEYKANQMTFNKVEDYRKVLFTVINRTKTDGACNIRRDELFTMFNYTVGGMSESPTTFTRFLGHKQVDVKPVSINGKIERGTQTNWADVSDFPQYLKDYFSDMKVKL